MTRHPPKSPLFPYPPLFRSVNQLAANLSTQVRAIADVATAVTKGDLTRSIQVEAKGEVGDGSQDRKSTRLNSSHLVISYAVFCLKKKRSTACATSHDSAHHT